MTGARASHPDRVGRDRVVLARRLLALRADPRPWIELALQIRTKDRRVIPLVLNAPQLHYYRNRTNRDVILKPRQLGFTTLSLALFFADCQLTPNTTSVMLAHDMDSTQQLFGIAQLFWERLPEEEKRRVGQPKYSNRREFFWPRMNSKFFVGTAGATRFGRGFTINNLHCSEFAYWDHPDDSLLAALEAVTPEGRVIVESTANGVGNPFHDLWLAAVERRSEFTPQFYVWWENPEYQLAGPSLDDLTEEEAHLVERWKLTDAQIRWRRQRIARLGDKFFQEYPEDWNGCFLASGRCAFNDKALRRLQARVAAEQDPAVYRRISYDKPNRTKEILNISPAVLLLWRPPQVGRNYVIGADVAEGLPDGAASCAVVLERESGEQVAELHGRVAPARFGEMLNALGRYYRMAWIGVERNNHGHSTLNTLYRQLHYPRLYRHIPYDAAAGRGVVPALGWPTTSATKPILVDDFVEAIDGGHIIVHSPGLVSECWTFIIDEHGNAGAQEGKFDDRVIAAAIAWQVRKRPMPRMTTERPPGM